MSKYRVIKTFKHYDMVGGGGDAEEFCEANGLYKIFYEGEIYECEIDKNYDYILVVKLEKGERYLGYKKCYMEKI